MGIRRPNTAAEPGHLDNTNQRSRGDNRVVWNCSAISPLESASGRIDAGRRHPIRDVATLGQPPAHLVQSASRVEKSRIVASVGILPLRAAADLRLVDRRLVAILWSDLAEKSGGIPLVEWIEENSAQRGSELLLEPCGHGFGLAIRVAREDLC